MNIAQSSHVQAHDYDQESRTLTVAFTNGAVYQYGGVDPATYAAFAQSSSPGGYLHAKIKGQFDARMIAPGASKRRKQ